MNTGFRMLAPDDEPNPGQSWTTVCSADEVDTLRDLSAMLKDAIDAMPESEEGLEDGVHFHGLWIGMLLGARVCKSFDSAYSWATFVRYNTDLVS